MITEITHADYEAKLKIITEKLIKTVQDRNNAILRAYNLIVDEIKLMLSKALLERKRRHLEIWYEYEEDNCNNEILREFVCMFCSVTLSMSKDKCIIEFDTDQETEKEIGKVAYNALIRVAYKHTMDEFTGFHIESSLRVDLNKTSQLSYFLNRQKEEDLRACLYDYEESLKHY